MVNIQERYATTLEPIKPTAQEANQLERLCEQAKQHNSGGSYDMLSMWSKGSSRIYGKNKLERLASTIVSDYPEICGVHAELDMWRTGGVRGGGTVFIAGRRSKSGEPIENTHPCVYCLALLTEMKIRSIVYYVNGKPTKSYIK